jgi:hypothetical protein
VSGAQDSVISTLLLVQQRSSIWFALLTLAGRHGRTARPWREL